MDLRLPTLERPMEIRQGIEPHIEVHKFYSGVVPAATALALLLQAFLPVHFHWAQMLELPMLVTIYFGMSRRNPASGLLLGTLIGILQDSLSRGFIGLYGIAKTLLGFVASSIGSRINTEHPLSRFALVLCFFHFHQGVLVLVKRLLLAQREPLTTMPLLIASLVNAALAVFLFPLLDRLRRPS
jgi:rod shape-determining protein MreD